MNSGNNFNKHKPKRIEKELLLLRNLPKEYKLGKRETPLGTLLYVIIYMWKYCFIKLFMYS
jgi:hypothetical protein